MIFVFVLAAGTNCPAQGMPKQIEKYKGSFFLEGKISLDSLTKYIHKLSGMRFSFNSVKVKGSKEITFVKGNYSFFEILQRIRNTTSLYYLFYSGYVIFQDNPPRRENKLSRVSKPNKPKPGAFKGNDLGGLQNKPLKTNHGDAKNDSTPSWVAGKPNKTIPGTGLAKLPAQKMQKDSAIFNKMDSLSVHLEKDNARLNDTAKMDVLQKIIKAGLAKEGDTSNTIIKNLNSPEGNPVKNKAKKNPWLHYGVQWNIDLPMYGFKDYFNTTPDKTQPYYLFIPAIWIGKDFGEKNNELVLLFKPGQQFLTGNKEVANSAEQISPQDSTIIKKSTTISTTNCIYGGVQYNFHVNDKWMISGGVNLYWQLSAVSRQKTTQLSDGSVLNDSIFLIKKNSADWQFLNPLFFASNLETSYSFKNFNTGMSVIIPVTSNFRAINAHLINSRIFIRWRIK